MINNLTGKINVGDLVVWTCSDAGSLKNGTVCKVVYMTKETFFVNDINRKEKDRLRCHNGIHFDYRDGIHYTYFDLYKKKIFEIE